MSPSVSDCRPAVLSQQLVWSTSLPFIHFKYCPEHFLPIFSFIVIGFDVCLPFLLSWWLAHFPLAVSLAY